MSMSKIDDSEIHVSVENESFRTLAAITIFFTVKLYRKKDLYFKLGLFLTAYFI